MSAATKHRSQFEILISAVDHDRLTGLAHTALERQPGPAEDLLSELDRATIATAKAMPSHVVRMGSTVAFRDGEGDKKRITLVYPGQADITENRISILTPLGTALIGLAQGQTAVWTTRDGKERLLEIASVEPPVSEVQS